MGQNKEARIPLGETNHSWLGNEGGLGDKAKDTEKTLSRRGRVTGGPEGCVRGDRSNGEGPGGNSLSKGRGVGRGPVTRWLRTRSGDQVPGPRTHVHPFHPS